MSHYKPYPAYKDSGVEWLGQVPEHWDTQRIRTLIDSAQNGIWGDDPDGGADDIPCARVADFDRNSFTVKGELPTLRKVPEAQRLSRQVNPGDLLIEKSGGGEQTTVGVVVEYQGGQPVICSNFVAVVKPKKGVFPRWLCYTNAHLYSVGVNVRSIKQTTGIQNIDSDQYFSERVAVPPESERQAISAHLDRETARIDALIEKKTRFIELLREKRLALITHAVTKGLEPNVKAKDSGVEWLGEVPEHWEVRSVSSVSTKITNGYVGPTRDILVEEGVRYLQSLHIKGNQIKFDVPYFVTEEWSNQHRKSILETGDVLIVQTGDIGQVTVVTDEFAGCNCHALIIVAPERSIIAGEWMSWVFNSSYGYHRLLSIQTGAMHPHLNCGNVKDVLLPVPPLSEQCEIMQRIEHEERRVAALVGKTERSIALLKERRSALITAAVTGQIDLREAV